MRHCWGCSAGMLRDIMISFAMLRTIFKQPSMQAAFLLILHFVTRGYVSSYDVSLLSWQARAIYSGLAQALLKVSDSHRSPLKQESQDARVDWVVKRNKAGLRKARKRPQYSKR